MADEDLRDVRTLVALVRERAAATPERVFLVETDGREVGWSGLAEEMDAWGRGLASLGVVRDDVVATMRRTSISGIAGWLGAAQLGAVDAGIATSYRGELLAALLAKARVLVVDPELLPVLVPLAGQLAHLAAVVVTGDGPAEAVGGLRVLTETELLGAGRASDAPLLEPQPWDTGCLTHTSGTTGPSKGVLLPWGQLYAFARSLFDPAELTADDVFYSPMPMNHVAQRVQTYLMAMVGGRVVLRNGFSASAYWADVRAHGCTVTNASVGAPILWAAPRTPEDAANPLRLALMSPLLPDFRAFADRFGLEVRTMFGSTEVGLPIVSAGTPPPHHRTSGRRNEGFPHLEVRLVDEHDLPVPVGTPGELVVRSPVPWTLNAGYLDEPAKTAEAWRNGWFHTGDLMVEDAEGWFSFTDRAKDSIRRRGENISSFEVEGALLRQPDVAEGAVVGVESAAWGEQDVLAVVVPRPGEPLDPAALVARLADALPAFMVPRYVRVVDRLPRSEATLRVQKGDLRAHGVDAGTWDRLTTTGGPS